MRISFKSLFSHTARTILTLLGIIVSVMAIMSVVTLGETLRRYVEKEIDAFGAETIQVAASAPKTRNASSGELDGSFNKEITTLTDKDAAAIGNLPDVVAYNIGLMGQARVAYDGTKRHVTLFGVSAAAPRVDSTIALANGRFFSTEEEQSAMNVVVLGATVAKGLTKGDPADLVGKRVTINNSRYVIVGVAKERGVTLSLSYDDMIYIPYTTLQKKILGIDYVSYIIVTAADSAHVERTASTIRTLLRLRHDIETEDEEDFLVTTVAEVQKTMNTILGGVDILLVALASISLLVGGIGIMNIMLVSIEERQREIGLRKALGAREKDMMTQFLIESVMIACVGAAVGIVITIVLLSLAFVGIRYAGFDGISFYIPTRAVVIALVFSVAAGVIFGVYPARRATKISPMEALAS